MASGRWRTCRPNRPAPRPHRRHTTPTESTNSTPQISPDDALKLWERYRATGDPKLRDRLVLSFAPLVKYIAFKKIRELPARCEVEDLISCGLIALIGALDRYDPGKGAALTPFLWTRIHGAILDELRRQDFAPRALRRQGRDIEDARQAFSAKQGHRPDDGELAEHLHIDRRTLRGRQDQLATCDVVSLNVPIQVAESPGEPLDMLVSHDDTLDPEQAAVTSEAKARFRVALRGLSERDREVAVLLYVNDLTQREVGEVLGVTDSRVSQIHSSIKRRLREALRDDEQLFCEAA